MFTLDNFILGLRRTMKRFNILKEDDILKITRSYSEDDIGGRSEYSFAEIPIAEIQMISESMDRGNTFNEYMLYRKTIFEIPVKVDDNSRMPVSRFINNGGLTVDQQGYNFQISRSSAEYVFAWMCYNATIEDNNAFVLPMQFSRVGENSLSSLQDLSDYFRLITVKISAPEEKTTLEFKKLLNSYLFNISYNHSIVFSVMDLSERRRSLRNRVTRRDGQLFPYKSYNNELVKYYYQGAAAYIPFTQYLAFYHVAEFFFQSIAEKDAFDLIEGCITRPSISPYKKEDIRLFYNKIKKKMREQREDGVWNEKTGLLLCLKKHIPDIGQLKISINSIDSSAVEYYKNNSIEFIEGDKKIDFDNLSDEVYTSIRDRVYSVRNSIVHSKEGEQSRYEPFKHDKYLAKEIPLIRAIAEEIIINSAHQMEI